MSATESDERKRSLETEENGSGDAKKSKQETWNRGTVLLSGATDWNDVGRKGGGNLNRSPNTIWKPVRLENLKDVDIVSVASGPSSCHSFAISADGKVYAWGRNEKGQLGIGDKIAEKKCPTIVEGLNGQKVVTAATGRNHSLFMTDNGDVFACGDNRFGQAVGGAKETTVYSPKQVVYAGPKAKRISCGAEFSAIVDVDGGLWLWGHPEHGQLGNNSDGSYLEKAGKVTYDYVYSPQKVTTFIEKDSKNKQSMNLMNVRIKEVSLGNNHGVVIDERNRGFSWGFGGYGRLGHSETGDEFVPRLIKFFDGPRRGIVKVTAGGQFNLASSEIQGTTYMWGQYSSAKEANMYPKPIPDLSGWMDVCSIACSGKGWIVSADETVIAAIPSPCYGELAMGPNKKSSASPVEVKTLTGVNVTQIAMGIAHSVFLARPNNEKEAEKIESIEVFNQKDQD